MGEPILSLIKFVYHLCKDKKGQAIFSFDQNVLDMLGNTTLCEPFALLIKIDQVFQIVQSLLDSKCQPVLSLIEIYKK